jgi:5-methylcytosine-specific restriction endonuclease McrA
MSLEGMTELFQGEGLSIENDDKLSSSSEDQFPCVVCNATFVTRMSLIRHMILHEDDTENDDGNYTKPSEDEQDVTVSQSQTHIPEQNLLENYLKTKYNKPSSSSSFNGSSTNTNGHNNNNVSVNGKRKRPVPNLKPLPSLIEMKTQVQTQQQQQKNFQCQLCGVFFWKKEDLCKCIPLK